MTSCFQTSRQTKWMITCSETVGTTITGTPIHCHRRASQQSDSIKMRLCSIQIIISFNSLNNSNSRNNNSSSFHTISNTFYKHKLTQADAYHLQPTIVNKLTIYTFWSEKCLTCQRYTNILGYSDNTNSSEVLHVNTQWPFNVWTCNRYEQSDKFMIQIWG